jgi:hypothetical protein
MLAPRNDGMDLPGTRRHDGLSYTSKNRPEAIRGSFVTGQL